MTVAHELVVIAAVPVIRPCQRDCCSSSVYPVLLQLGAEI